MYVCVCVELPKLLRGIVIIADVAVVVAASASASASPSVALPLPPLLLTYLPCTIARHEAGPGQETMQVVCVYILCFVVFVAFLFRCLLLLLLRLFTLAHTDRHKHVNFGNI